MPVFHITTTRRNAAGHCIWHLMELPQESVAEIVATVDAGQMVHGMRLVTKPDTDDPDAREIVSTEELALAPSQVAEVRVSRTRIVRYES